jgi:replication factor A2
MDYQGDSGGGGGGFAAGSQPGSSSGGRARRSPDEQTVLPVTVLMLLQSTTVDDRPQLADGRALHRVRLVAAVRNFEDMSTNIVYDVEDGTGLLRVKEWLDDHKENAKTAELREQTKKENVYVKITGQLKDYDGHKQLVADSIRPLRSGNELAHHFLDVVHTEQAFRRKQQPSQTAAFTPGFGARPLQAAQAVSHSGGGGVREALLALMKQSASEQGVSIAHCAKTLPYPEATIRQTIDLMSQEGIVYSTIDEDHYLPAF